MACIGCIRIYLYRLHPLPLPLHRVLCRSLARVKRRQTLGPGLVVSGDPTLLARLLVPVPGQHAGVVADLLRQVEDLLTVRQLGLQFQAGGVGVGREAVGDMGTQPDDGGDLVLDAGQGVDSISR